MCLDVGGSFGIKLPAFLQQFIGSNLAVMAKLLCLLVVTVTLLFCSSFAKIPTACRLKDPNLDNCLKDNINNFISLLASESFPEIFFEPLDPLKMKDHPFRIDANNKSHLKKLDLSELVVTGLGKTKLTYIRSDFSNQVNPTLEIKITNPELVISGNWNGEMLFGVTHTVYGKLKVQLKDIVTKGKLIMENIKGQDGKEYFTVKSVDFDYELGSHKFYGTDIFSTFQQIDKNWTYKIKEENFLAYLAHMLPQVKPYINDIVKNKINEYTSKISTDNIVKP